MKIGINALFIRPGWHGGTEVYLRNLLRTLLAAGCEHEFYLFTNQENHSTFTFTAPNIKKVLIPIQASLKPLRVLMEQFALPYQVRKLGLDVIHGPGYTSPIMAPCARVVTVHDMQYCYYPEVYPKGEYLFFKTFIPLSAKNSTAIITDAHSTQLDLEKFLAIPSEKIKVIHLAPAPHFFVQPSPEQVRLIQTKYNLPDQYILTVSSFRPQKNTLRLIEAYADLKKRGVTTHKLVLVGRKLAPYSKARQLIETLGLDRDIIVTGYVPDEDLPAIYTAAGLFVFPSFFEGFGIPVLEAMACGVPVILSNTASLPEAGGEAGYYIDPYNVDEITEAMYTLLNQPTLHAAFSAKSRFQASQFSWEQVAAKTMDVYKQASIEFGR